MKTRGSDVGRRTHYSPTAEDVGRTVTVLTRTVKYVKSLTWDVFGTATVFAPRD